MLKKQNQKLITDKMCPKTAQQEIASVKENQSLKKRYWQLSENKSYVQFLRENMKVMSRQSKRRFQRIFLDMSYNISTKTAEQCRTHHQKALQKYGNLEAIVKCLLPDLLKKEQKRQQKHFTEEVVQRNDCYELKKLKDSSFKLTINLDSLASW